MEDFTPGIYSNITSRPKGYLDPDTGQPKGRFSKSGEFLPTDNNVMAKIKIKTKMPRERVEDIVREHFEEWRDFAAGLQNIEYKGKTTYCPLHPSGRYATSLSYSIRKSYEFKDDAVSYVISFIANVGMAPEAKAIEFGRPKIDLKKYMLKGAPSRKLMLKGNRYSLDPTWKFEQTGAYLSEISRRGSSFSEKLYGMRQHAELNSTISRFAVMSGKKKDSWVMRKWPHKTEDGKMTPYQPAHILMEKLMEILAKEDDTQVKRAYSKYELEKLKNSKNSENVALYNKIIEDKRWAK